MDWTKRGIVAVALTATLWAGFAEVGSTVQAQCDPTSVTCNQVGADGKGILAGGILGAEIGFLIPAIIIHAGARELDEWWSWILFPVVGAVGGAVAGYFALEDPTQTDATGTVTQRGFPEVAVAMLAVSMALIVPTFVGVLALTHYNPGPDTGSGASGDEDSADDAPDEGDEQTNEAEPAEQSALRRTLAGGPGLFRVDRGQLLLGIPMVGATARYTDEERAHLRLPQASDIHIPVVSGVF